jgi:hypothetical protein
MTGRDNRQRATELYRRAQDLPTPVLADQLDGIARNMYWGTPSERRAVLREAARRLRLTAEIAAKLRDAAKTDETEQQ